jgi:uncharacterized membrane protein YhaH (DUF805 family)
MDWGHLLFGFRGRINRAKYWLWVLLYFIAAIVVSVIIYLIDSPIFGGILQVAFSIVVIITALAVTTKRLHDRSKSAWWLLVFWLVPSILLGIGIGVYVYSAVDTGGSTTTAIIVGGVMFALAFALTVWAFIELACLRGTVGPNAYGPDPLEGRTV